MIGRLVRFLLFSALVAGFGLAATAAVRNRAASTEVAAAPAVEAVVELADVEVARVERQDLSDEIRLTGSMRPVRRTNLNAEVSGTIREIAADVGDAVRAGEVILRFDTETLESVLGARIATLDARNAQLRLARSTLERSRQLGQRGIASDASLLTAEADVLNFEAQVRALEADVNDARRSLRDAEVKAPFDGVVASRSVEAGQAVANTAELFTIVDLSGMEVDAAVPTSRIADVRVGQQASFAVEGFSDTAFLARVVRISPTAEAGSRSVRVFLSVGNEAGRLRGGMFATGTLRIRQVPDVIALPAVALRSDGEGAFVLKAANGRLVRQGVELGERWAERGLVEIAAGLHEGDVVVTAPLPDLQADTEVRIAEL